jgi:hypothetical protein
MKKFDFPLDQALRWRQIQANLQQARLAAAAVVRLRIEAEIEALHKEAEREYVLIQHPGSGVSLDSWAGFRARSQRALESLEKQAAGARSAEAGEMIRLREADQKYRILEQLRDSQLLEWRKQFDRETESLAAEAFLCTLQSRKRNSA